jgi:glutathione peroxidase
MVSENLYEIKVKDIRGSEKSMGDFEGKVLLIVNVASQCGFTPQYKELQEIYEKYKNQGFEVLGFPCNQFGGQEPGSDDEIKKSCEMNFGVSFPMFSKVEVNGEGAHPLFKLLKSKAKGVLGTEAIKWNFTKFLINRKGEVIDRFASTTSPKSISLEIEKLL